MELWQRRHSATEVVPAYSDFQYAQQVLRVKTSHKAGDWIFVALVFHCHCFVLCNDSKHIYYPGSLRSHYVHMKFEFRCAAAPLLSGEVPDEAGSARQKEAT